MKRLETLSFAMLSMMCRAVGAQTVEVDVKGMVCELCVHKIDAALRHLPATADVIVDLAHQFVAVQVKADASIDDAALRSAIVEQGFEVLDVRHTQTSLAALRARAAAQPAAGT